MTTRAVDRHTTPSPPLLYCTSLPVPLQGPMALPKPIALGQCSQVSHSYLDLPYYKSLQKPHIGKHFNTENLSQEAPHSYQLKEQIQIAKKVMMIQSGFQGWDQARLVCLLGDVILFSCEDLITPVLQALKSVSCTEYTCVALLHCSLLSGILTKNRQIFTTLCNSGFFQQILFDEPFEECYVSYLAESNDEKKVMEGVILPLLTQPIGVDETVNYLLGEMVEAVKHSSYWPKISDEKVIKGLMVAADEGDIYKFRALYTSDRSAYLSQDIVQDLKSAAATQFMDAGDDENLDPQTAEFLKKAQLRKGQILEILNNNIPKE